MSDVPPPPDDVPPPPGAGASEVPPAPPPVPSAPPPPPQLTYGVAPRTLEELYYKPWPNILLYIITCGIWGAVWTYRTNGDLKRYNGDGLGEVPGLLLALFISPVVMFTIPNEIEHLYQRDGRESPVSTLWGLWFLLPIVGSFIWYFKVQRSLNDFWASKGAIRAL